MKTLTQKEMTEIEGGIAPFIIWAAAAFGGALIGSATSNVFDNWADFKQGFREGFQNTAA